MMCTQYLAKEFPNKAPYVTVILMCSEAHSSVKSDQLQIQRSIWARHLTIAQVIGQQSVMYQTASNKSVVSGSGDEYELAKEAIQYVFLSRLYLSQLISHLPLFMV